MVTILPKHEGDAAANVSAQSARKLKVSGKDTSITNLVPLTGSRDGLDLVVLIDSAARNSLGNQLRALAQFIKNFAAHGAGCCGLYANSDTRPLPLRFTSDHAQAIGGLHLPGGTLWVERQSLFLPSVGSCASAGRKAIARRGVKC